MAKRLYTAYSAFERLWTIVLRLALVFATVYSLLHFEENPVVISIVVIICILLLLFIGDDQITVYPDKLIQRTNSLYAFFFKTTGTVYEMANIKSASLRPESAAAEVAAVALVVMILPKKPANSNISKPIYLETKDGRTITINTNLERSQMEKIVGLVNTIVE